MIPTFLHAMLVGLGFGCGLAAVFILLLALIVITAQ